MPRSQRLFKFRFLLTLSLVYGCTPTLPASQSSTVPTSLLQPSGLPVVAASKAPEMPLATPSPALFLRLLSQGEIKQVRESGLVEANNTFAWQLMNNLFAEDPAKNHFMSPISASLALQMALLGAEGETLSEMRQALGLEAISEAQLLENVPLLVNKLQRPAPDIALEVANSLWASEKCTLEGPFAEKLKTAFDAEAQNVDFADRATVDLINSWASQKTHGKIPKIADQFHRDTLLVLLNALYFKASWTSRFELAETQEKDFYAENGARQKVPMMRKFATFTYLSPSKDFPHQGIQLPYGEQGKVAMYLFLPTTGKKLRHLLADLKKVGFDELNTRFYQENGSLQMPRFTLKQNFSLIDALKQQGMHLAFDMYNADFDRMVGGGGYLSEVQQFTYVEVHEEGTEAAAVTKVVATPLASSEPLKTLDMVVDHPFLFLIRDQDTGQILFMGTVTDP